MREFEHGKTSINGSRCRQFRQLRQPYHWVVPLLPPPHSILQNQGKTKVLLVLPMTAPLHNISLLVPSSKTGKLKELQEIPASCDFIIHDPRYFVILKWKNHDFSLFF